MTMLASTQERMQKRATRAAFGPALIELAAEGVPVVAVDADLSGSTTLAKFAASSEENAQRFFNVGIAEQNMIDVAAGLSLTGKVAFTGSFAVFGTGRVYDQIRNTVCYGDLDVKVCPTHAGISVGPDGGTHQMLEDIALMRALPKMKVLVPADYASALSAIHVAASVPGPVYVRMGRASVNAVYADGAQMRMGRAHILREGSDVTIVACGVEVTEALKAAEILQADGIQAEVIDAFSVKPLDEATIIASAAKTGCVVTAEEHSIYGGLGEAVAHVLAAARPVPCELVGMQDKFGKSGSFDELMVAFGLDADAIRSAALRACERKERFANAS